jgi:hypothetical protein
MEPRAFTYARTVLYNRTMSPDPQRYSYMWVSYKVGGAS